MQLLGTYGRLARQHMDSFVDSVPTLGNEALDTGLSAASAFAAGYLSAKSNLKGKGGKVLGMPIPLAGALVLGACGAATGAGETLLAHSFLSGARGFIDAQATMSGIKMAYGTTNGPAVVTGVPQMRYFQPYPIYAGVPQMGATPQTEQMFAHAGLTPMPQPRAG